MGGLYTQQEAVQQFLAIHGLLSWGTELQSFKYHPMRVLNSSDITTIHIRQL